MSETLRYTILIDPQEQHIELNGEKIDGIVLGLATDTQTQGFDVRVTSYGQAGAVYAISDLIGRHFNQSKLPAFQSMPLALKLFSWWSAVVGVMAFAGLVALAGWALLTWIF